MDARPARGRRPRARRRPRPVRGLFSLAFLPQLVRPGGPPVPVQLLVLGVAVIVLALCVDSLWALVGDLLRRAVADYLKRERAAVAREIALLGEESPYRKQ